MIVPTVLTYEVKEEEIQLLRVLRFGDYSEEWAKFILLNRNNSSRQPAHDYDIVIGPIANDRVGLQLWKYEKTDTESTLVQSYELTTVNCYLNSRISLSWRRVPSVIRENSKR